MAPRLRVVGPEETAEHAPAPPAPPLAPAPPHSRPPGSPCGPASAGSCSASGRCCRRARYLRAEGPSRGAAGEGRAAPSHQHPGEAWLWGGRRGLTGREAAAEEHVEEVFRGDVGLKATVEVPVAVAVPGRLALVITELVVLLPLFRVAEHGIRCADG